MIKKIYFDMDGVLADFDRGIREFCGMDAVSQDYGKKPGMDTLMWERASKIPHFYDQLELMPGAKEMFDAVQEEKIQRILEAGRYTPTGSN